MPLAFILKGFPFECRIKPADRDSGRGPLKCSVWDGSQVEELIESIPHTAGMIILIALSAFFSASETAFFSIGRERQRRYAAGAKLSEKLIAKLLRHPRNLLIVLLFSNLIVNVLFLSIGSGIGIRMAEGGARTGAVVWAAAVFAFLIVFGEITPKIIANRYPARVALVGVDIIYALQKVFFPITFLLGFLSDVFTRLFLPGRRRRKFITQDELEFLASAGRRQGFIDKRQEKMLLGTINLSAIRVRDVMKPHVDIVAYEAGGAIEGLIEKARASGRKHIPIFENSIDNVIGIVNIKDVCFGEGTRVRDYLKPVVFVPELKTALSLLRFFRESRSVIAIAVDEYGQTAGLVTLEDIVEEIFGEIQDESDVEEELVRKIADNTYVISGSFNVKEWEGLFEEELAASGLGDAGSQVSTLGGFVTMLFQRLPQAGESVKFKNLRFTVKETKKRRITKIMVEYIEPENAETKEETD